MTRRSFLLAFLFWMICADYAEAAIKVRITYIVVENEVSPLQQVHRTEYSNVYTLSGHNVAIDTKYGNSNGRIGSEKHIINSFGSHISYKTSITKGAVVIRSTNPGNSIVTKIATDGTSSCQATRKAFRRPGQQYFTSSRISNGDKMLISDLHFENVRCEIESQ